MDIEHSRKLFPGRMAAEAGGGARRLLRLGVMVASCTGFWGGMPAIANVSPLKPFAPTLSSGNGG